MAANLDRRTLTSGPRTNLSPPRWRPSATPGGGLEYEIPEDDPMPRMDKSFAYMRGVLTGMG